MKRDRTRTGAASSVSGMVDAFADLNALCIGNKELERLEILLDKFNLFEAVGLRRQETKHSNFLAFLLDPKQPHGLGDSFLELFLQRSIRPELYESLRVSPLHVHLWDLRETLVDREWSNIDIVVRNEQLKLVVVIENKVNIGEHSGQLRRYRRIVNGEYVGWKSVFILLSPDGFQSVDDPEYIPIGYSEVSGMVRNLLVRNQASIGPDVAVAIRHYADLLERHLMNESEIDELCSSIYRKHKRAIDLIVSKRSDRQASVRAYFEKVLGNTGDFKVEETTNTSITFVPDEWRRFIPIASVKNDEFERLLLICVIQNNKDSVKLLLQMRPMDDVFREQVMPVRKAIFDYAKTHPPLKPGRVEMTEAYTKIFDKELLGPAAYGLDQDEFLKKLANSWIAFSGSDLPILRQMLLDAVSPTWGTREDSAGAADPNGLPGPDAPGK